jgi:hypothetical protein
VRIDDDDPLPSGRWNSYFGPVILTRWRRRLYALLLIIWTAALSAAAADGSYGILWLPAVGIVTSSILLLRDRAGRRRWM